MTDVARVPTGIPGLDDLIEGGFPKESVSLVSGPAGAGKTLFSLQYLMTGVEKGETCLFISLEEPAEDIIADAEVFGWDIEGNDNIEIQYIRVASSQSDFIDRVNKLVEETDADRLALDSVSIMLGTYGGDEVKKRDTMYNLLNYLKRSDATTLLTSEIREAEGDTLSRYNVAEFVVDGVIRLYYEGVGEGTFRNLEVRKMRRTAHTPGTYPFRIADDGITVRSNDSL